MAKANWVKLSKSSGSGNDTVNVSSATANTGRNVRTTFLTWSAENVEDITRQVAQAGKTEYVSMASSAAANKEGHDVTIKGMSNSSKLTFSLGTGGTLTLNIPNTYLANSITATNGTAIPGDPGATAEYEFSITITVPKNEETEPKTAQLVVKDSANNTKTCTITSAAGDAYVRLDSLDTIELGWEEGSSKTVNVYSNTNWEIE